MYACASPETEKSYISKSKFRAKNGREIPLLSEDKSYEHVYVDGLSVISFLIRDKGKNKFKEFNHKLKDGIQFEKALLEVYDFRGIDALDKAWNEYLLRL